MIRNLKVLGLVLAVAMAFGAAGASAANFTSSKYPVSIDGNQLVNASFPTGLEYEFNGNVFTCTEAYFQGSVITGPQSELEVTPLLGGHCTSQGGAVGGIITVTHNGCKYNLTPGTGSGSTWTGSIHLVCPKGVTGIEIHVYQNHANKESRCTYVEHPQTVKNITYHNVSSTYLLITVLSTVVTTRISGSPLLCGAATINAIYRGEVTLATKTETGEMTNWDIG